MVFKKIRDAFSSSVGDEAISPDYLEIDLEQEEKENKVMVKLFVLKEYEGVTAVLSALREGYTIAIIDIKLFLILGLKIPFVCGGAFLFPGPNAFNVYIHWAVFVLANACFIHC